MLFRNNSGFKERRLPGFYRLHAASCSFAVGDYAGSALDNRASLWVQGGVQDEEIPLNFPNPAEDPQGSACLEGAFFSKLLKSAVWAASSVL